MPTATKNEELTLAEDRFVPLRDGARRLGISVRTSHRMRGHDAFPPLFVIGGRLKYRKSDLDSFIANGGRVDA